MSRSDRMFRRLLRLFPAEFRADFGDDMAETFRDHREAMVNRGDGRSAFALWWHTIVGIVRTAPREHVAQLTTDVRYALRNLRRHPAFTFISILALAVGIGANTAVFTIVDGVLLRSLPYEKPEQLLAIFEKSPRRPGVEVQLLGAGLRDRARLRPGRSPASSRTGAAASSCPE